MTSSLLPFPTAAASTRALLFAHLRCSRSFAFGDRARTSIGLEGLLLRRMFRRQARANGPVRLADFARLSSCSTRSLASDLALLCSRFAREASPPPLSEGSTTTGWTGKSIGQIRAQDAHFLQCAATQSRRGGFAASRPTSRSSSRAPPRLRRPVAKLLFKRSHCRERLSRAWPTSSNAWDSSLARLLAGLAPRSGCCTLPVPVPRPPPARPRTPRSCRRLDCPAELCAQAPAPTSPAGNYARRNSSLLSAMARWIPLLLQCARTAA